MIKRLFYFSGWTLFFFKLKIEQNTYKTILLNITNHQNAYSALKIITARHWHVGGTLQTCAPFIITISIVMICESFFIVIKLRC